MLGLLSLGLLLAVNWLVFGNLGLTDPEEQKKEVSALFGVEEQGGFPRQMTAAEDRHGVETPTSQGDKSVGDKASDKKNS